MFFTKKESIDSVIHWLFDNNYWRTLLINNTYDSGHFLKENCLVHYIERLFGLITLD